MGQDTLIKVCSYGMVVLQQGSVIDGMDGC